MSDIPISAPPISSVPVKSTLIEILEKSPIHETKRVSHLYESPGRPLIDWPQEIRVYCGNVKCDGVRRHKNNSSQPFLQSSAQYFFGLYHCTDCQQYAKVYALKCVRKSDVSLEGDCTKIYQDPTFGDPIPKNFFKLIGEDNREIFLQARRSVARGLGIGAYAYYRRIIEVNKIELVKAILDVAEKTGAPNEQTALLKRAAEERQFTKAIDMLKEVKAIPPTLLISGQNPLLLLHDLLSEGIHALTDEQCLERAKETEIVLFEIARLIQIAVTERRELSDALNRIAHRNQVKTN